jgi:hypothetical protein
MTGGPVTTRNAAGDDASYFPGHSDLFFDSGHFGSVLTVGRWNHDRAARGFRCRKAGNPIPHPKPIAGGSMSSISIKQRAEARFRKPPGREDSNSVRSDYEAAADALAAKIARLKELRLARDAAALAAPPPAKKTGKSKKPSKRTKRKKVPGLSLLDWMKNRQIAGQ